LVEVKPIRIRTISSIGPSLDMNSDRVQNVYDSNYTLPYHVKDGRPKRPKCWLVEADSYSFATMQGWSMVLHLGQHHKDVMLVSMFSILIQSLQEHERIKM
jgi:hypothetical protein